MSAVPSKMPQGQAVSRETLLAFQEIGRDLFLAGLVSSHGGNMSVRRGGSLIITRHGSRLGRLKKNDIVEVGLEASSHPLASSELVVHRALYQVTKAAAVVHAHPPVAIALSLVLPAGEIVPLDLESAVLIGKIPVIEVGLATGSQELADAMCDSLCDRKIVMVRGHGSFAVGETLEEAYEWTSCLEQASRVLLASMLVERKG